MERDGIEVDIDSSGYVYPLLAPSIASPSASKQEELDSSGTEFDSPEIGTVLCRSMRIVTFSLRSQEPPTGE